jgi:hypothetical protein
MFGTKGLAPGQPAAAPAARQPVRNGRRFDVTPKPLRSALAALFFAGCTYAMWLELLDPRGVIIDHMITLGPQGANVFFGALLLVSAGFTLTGALLFARSLGERRWLTFDHDAVRGPKSAAGSRELRIAYRAIEKAVVTRTNRQEFVTIVGGGRAITVRACDFRTKDEYREFLSELHDRIDARHLQ